MSGHDLAMFSRWQHVLISQGHIQMAGQSFCRICSVTCPQHVLTVSGMSSIPPVTKQFANQPIFHINLCKFSLIPLSKKSFQNSSFANINFNMKQIEVSLRDLHFNHKKCIAMHSHHSPPLCLSDSFKIQVFSSFCFSTTNYVIKLNCGKW